MEALQILGWIYLGVVIGSITGVILPITTPKYIQPNICNASILTPYYY